MKVKTAEIMDKIADKESNGPSISHKEDNATLAAYFKEVLPDYDEERVISDIKKNSKLVQYAGV
jgi:hypothetical protein